MAKPKRLKPDAPYVITVACQKGGVGKSTCSVILSTLLAEMGYRVLGVDLDSQGNYTETFTGLPIRQMRRSGFLGVVYAINPVEDPHEFLWDEKLGTHKLPPNFNLLIGDEHTGFFSEKMSEYGITKRNHAVENTLQKFGNEYDFIVLDTAPALSPILTNALIASDGVVAMYQPEYYCYNAMFSLFETIEDVKKANPKLNPLGILTALMDVRRSDMKDYIAMLREDEHLGKYCFDTVIKRTASTGRLSYAGISNEDNPEAKIGMKQYKSFVKELLQRGKASQS